MKRFLALAAGLALSACAAGTSTPGVTVGVTPPASTSLNSLATFTVADLNAAAADATAHGDTIAALCYPALAKFVTGLQGAAPTGTVAGAFAAFQKARDLGNTAQAGVPSYLVIGCAPLVQDSTMLLGKLAAIGGAAAVGVPPIVALP